MSVSRFLSRSFIALSCMLVVTFAAHAQYRAGIQGTVLDPQGEAVADATITVTAKETGLTQTTTSDANGVYSVTRLGPGPHTTTAEKAGFNKQEMGATQ